MKLKEETATVFYLFYVSLKKLEVERDAWQVSIRENNGLAICAKVRKNVPKEFYYRYH